MESRYYYVYALLDPREKGPFLYGDYCFQHEPFYIGKGKGDRVLKHYKTCAGGSIEKINRIHELTELGFEPMYVKLLTLEYAEQAYAKEKELIWTIGNKINGSGPLLNISLTSSDPNKYNGLMKKSIDIPEDLYDLVMAYAYTHKIYKFGPAVISLIKEALKEQ